MNLHNLSKEMRKKTATKKTRSNIVGPSKEKKLKWKINKKNQGLERLRRMLVKTVKEERAFLLGIYVLFYYY